VQMAMTLMTLTLLVAFSSAVSPQRDTSQSDVKRSPWFHQQVRL